MSNFVPLSVREGNRRRKIGWAVKGYREWLALRLAPWLTPSWSVTASLDQLAKQQGIDLSKPAVLPPPLELSDEEVGAFMCAINGPHEDEWVNLLRDAFMLDGAAPCGEDSASWQACEAVLRAALTRDDITQEIRDAVASQRDY